MSELAFRRWHVRVPLVAASLVICSRHLHHTSGAQGVLLCEGWG